MANTTVYPYGQNGSLPGSIGIVNDFQTGGADKALSAEVGKTIGTEVFGEMVQFDLSTLAPTTGLINSADKWDTDSVSTCVFLPCTPGKSYKFVNNSGRTANIAPLTVSSWGPQGGDPSFATGYSGRIVMSNGDELVIVAPEDAVSFYIRTTNSSGNDDAPDVYGLDDYEGGLVNKVEELENAVGALDAGERVAELIIGSLVNKGNDSNGLPGTANAKRVGSVTTLAVPYKGVKIKFHLPPKYVGEVRSGAKAQDLNNNNYWYRDGDTFTFSESANYYRIVFAIQPVQGVSNYDDIDADDTEALIASGDIKITYSPVDLDAVKRNAPSDAYVKSAIQMLTTNPDSGLDKFPIIIHTSDIHGDAYRLKDAVDVCKVNNADFLLATGDIIANKVQNGYEALETIMENSPIPTLFCRGNHETYGNTDPSFDSFATYYSKLATKWNYLKVAGTVTDKTYYYKDFDAKKIRVISLDPYEKNVTTNKAYAMSQGQVDFFIATIKSTPANYGIIVIMHSPEAYPNNTMPIEAVTGKTDFYPYREITVDAPAGIAGTPLKDIVDAFISRTTISESFTQTITGGTTETITISGDFTSGINSGVEFIAWMTGHTHNDIVGIYKNTVNRQVMLNVTCGICYYGPSDYAYLCNGSDIPRGSFGVTQDAINVYAIDRAKKEIRIARIGANFTEAFTDRKCMVISYANE